MTDPYDDDALLAIIDTRTVDWLNSLVHRVNWSSLEVDPSLPVIPPAKFEESHRLKSFVNTALRLFRRQFQMEDKVNLITDAEIERLSAIITRLKEKLDELDELDLLIATFPFPAS